MAPESVVTARASELAAFLNHCGRIVVKPLEECSGRGLFLVTLDDPNHGALLEQATLQGTRFVQGQRFLPEVAAGDKRVLLLDGNILGAVRRLPAPGDFRANINAGATCHRCTLNAQEVAISSRVGRWLAKEGIVLAGIDLVGEWLLEVNITSPSCLREINELEGVALESRVLDSIETRCRDDVNAASSPR
jgi:glutathione synthase